MLASNSVVTDNNSDTSQASQAVAKLLFVDDERNILTSLKRLFRPQGYCIFMANSGAQALDILGKENIDLVISDMRMPEMDGAQFLEKVAQQWPETVRILLTGYADLTSTVNAINKGNIYQYISKPWEDNDIKLSVKHALEQKYLSQERQRLEALTHKQNQELKKLNDHLEDKVKARTEELRQTMAQLEITYQSLKTSYSTSVKVFSSLIEMRHHTADGHAQRVADSAYKLALNLGLSGNDAQDVLYAALLHDIGKIGLPDKLLNSPLQSLPAPDRKEVKKHPLVGQAILMSLEPLQGAGIIIRNHHEQYDGGGYPDGLKNEDIPFGARILAVVNDYDSLQLGMEWEQPMSATKAMNFIKRHSGKRYDAKIVSAFIASEEGTEQQVCEEQEIRLRCRDLLPGMTLSRNLYTKDNILLLSKGHSFDERLIEKIINLENSLNYQFSLYVKTNSCK